MKDPATETEIIFFMKTSREPYPNSYLRLVDTDAKELAAIITVIYQTAYYNSNERS